MTDRYSKTFTRLKKRLGFCPFAVIGHPNEKESFERIKLSLKYADMLELGIPFSDPIADGPTIQQADMQALKADMTPIKALKFIKKIRSLTDIPIGILVYANIVHAYGIEAFYKKAKHCGVDSILIADVPLEEMNPYAKAAKKNHIHQIMMVSKNTTQERLKLIEKKSSGFLYVVSAVNVTGAKKELPSLHFTEKWDNTLPLVVGFGISKKEHVKKIQSRYKKISAFIIGSYLVKTPLQDLEKELKQFSTKLSTR